MIRLAFPRPGGGKFIDPWDGIRERVGDGRDKKLVVTKRGYMEKSKKTTPDYSHIKEVILVDMKGAFEIGLGGDQSDLFTFLCFVLNDLNLRAPRSLPIIAKYLLTGTFVENFEKSIDVGTKDFCFLQLMSRQNPDYSIPQRTGQSSVRVFMMSRATGNFVVSEKMRRTKDGKLADELKHKGKCFGYIEDMGYALKSGGANSLAKYFATLNPGNHIALPPVDPKTLYLTYDWIQPRDLYRPGILKPVMRRGRPLKMSVCDTVEEKEATASLERVSCVDAESGGWVVSW